MDIARETNDMADPEEIARKLNARYKRNAVQYTGDMNEIPQRLLMPSVHDASLWQIRVKVRLLLLSVSYWLSDRPSDSPAASVTLCSV